MGDSVSFKAYLKRDGHEVEVRRFGIDGGAATNYMYLIGKVQAMFPSLQTDQFNIFWQDNDNDYITISSDEELMVALTAAPSQPLKLYIHLKSSQPQGGSGQQYQHPGVVCDSCEGPVTGYRYKCVTCPDFDLCAACEAGGKHPEHFMLRMPTPMGSSCHPKLVRKLFGRQHKFYKRHGWDRFYPMGGESHETGRCPFSQRERGSASAGAVPDMFDFSALMEFINSLGVATNAAAEGEATASTQTATGSQPQAQATSSQTQTGQSAASPEPQQQGSQHKSPPNPNTYLTGIGQAIAAFLDPFGVDVTFDVRQKNVGTHEPTGEANQQESATPSTPSYTSPVSETTPLLVSSAPVSPHPPTETGQDSAPPAAPAAAHARRSSDDWTLLNRESPARSEAAVAMDVEENRDRPKTVYPKLPKETPSAPLQTDSVFSDIERQRIQEAVERISAMGFNFDSALLRDLLRRENCDIATVLELILSNAGKK